jgi:hypothetical protein
VDPAEIYADALGVVAAIGSLGGQPALPLPVAVPMTVGELRDKGFGAAALLGRIRAAQAPLLPST